MRGNVLRMWLTVIISLALTQGRVEIIKGGTKKKRPAVVAPAETSQSRDDKAAAELAAKEKALEEKEKAVDARAQDLEKKQKDLDEREEKLQAEKEEEKKRQTVQRQQAEKLQRDQGAAMGQITDALNGN